MNIIQVANDYRFAVLLRFIFYFPSILSIRTLVLHLHAIFSSGLPRSDIADHISHLVKKKMV